MRNVAVLLTIVFGTGRAAVVVDTSLNLTQLQITPAFGTVEWILPPTSSAFAHAHDSLGGFDQNFDSNNSATAVIATAILASAAGSSSVITWTGASASHVNIPSGDASAQSTGRGALAGAFRIIGYTDPVSVQFSATLAGNQELSTDATGILASSEIIFTFQLDSETDPTLSVNRLYTIGPSSSLSSPYSNTLSAPVTLTPGAAYGFYAEVDAESSGVNVPEPWSAPAVLLAFGAVLARRARSRR